MIENESLQPANVEAAKDHFRLAVGAVLTIDLSLTMMKFVPKAPDHLDPFAYAYPLDGQLIGDLSRVEVAIEHNPKRGDEPVGRSRLGPASTIFIFDQSVGPGKPRGMNCGPFISLEPLNDRSHPYFEEPFNCRVELSLPTDLYHRMMQEVQSGALRRIVIRTSMQPVASLGRAISLRYSVELLYGGHKGWGL